ncbi:hypothetical protein [Mesorhizobium sp. LjNodule214]|uniref:hypothetical protein n=1 Tax=Mesorhizobium sp. LjNodule214 TaxID=3342252 RepID=UPI003ED10B9E
MGSVSLFEDISDRLNDDALNAVVAARSRVNSIKHLPDGPGVQSPRLRSEIAALSQEFEYALHAIVACHRQPLPTKQRKHLNAGINQAVESSRLMELVRQSMAKLAKAYPSGHPARKILEDGLVQTDLPFKARAAETNQ